MDEETPVYTFQVTITPPGCRPVVMRGAIQAALIEQMNTGRRAFLESFVQQLTTAVLDKIEETERQPPTTPSTA